MKDFYAKDAPNRENQEVTSFFLITSKQVRIKRNGEPYLALTLSEALVVLASRLGALKRAELDAALYNPIFALYASR